jgi:arabinose-5-phosphate isomerase
MENKNYENNLDSFLSIFDAEIESLILAKSRISDNYLMAAELIAKANKVILSGIGKSGLIARKIAATLSSYNISAVFLHPVEALHGDIGIVQEKDVVILLSKSGSTEEIIRLVPFIKSRNAKIISIVTNLNSFLSTNSDITLEASITQEACPFNLAPTSSTTVSLAIGDAIAIIASQIRNFSQEDFSKTHPLGAIGKTISLKVKDIMKSGKDLPVIYNDSTFKELIIEISGKALGCIVIIDEQSNLLGFVTDGDIRRALQSDKDVNLLKASQIMSKNPVTVHDDAFIEVAIALMESRESQINSLVVLNSMGKVVGVLRLHDIIRSGI